MDLHSSQKFWQLKNGPITDYASLNQDLKTDVIIMGGGVSGALVAHALCERGVDVVILDKRHAASGSTAASTALLQYEIDQPLHKLIELVGEDVAVRSYLLCQKAIGDLQKISKNLPINPHFELKPSFQFASFKSHIHALEKEFELRRKFNISTLDWLEEKEIENKYGFKKEGGILSQDGAEVDPYRLTHALLKKHHQKNLKIFDNTKVVAIQHHKNSVEVKTEGRHKIRGKKLVIACGYESQRYLPKKIEILNSTYVIISEVMKEKKFWDRNSLIWETADPYLYIRTTFDNRILVGGKDDHFYDPKKRDRSLPLKAQALKKSFEKLFPLLNFKTDYQWAGTFCGTKDGLPYIGSIPERSNTFFALGFGGNGITFSVIAAQIIADLITGRKNENSELLSFKR